LNTWIRGPLNKTDPERAAGSNASQKDEPVGKYLSVQQTQKKQADENQQRSPSIGPSETFFSRRLHWFSFRNLWSELIHGSPTEA
tara:strand:+ start:3289 stop:3543 length:255 start_codon:yes stop_codon:yes gene_type:complete